ncbi:MAG: NADH-quinone oxidoreductase subunit L [Planctomycetia bacterium]|nr:NADH-quinone oxidoreductase subunit L [Planctomycetia bacterium]
MYDLGYLMVLIPALPLSAAVVTAALGKRVLREQSHWPALAAVAASFLASAVLLYRVYEASRSLPPGSTGFQQTVSLWNWAFIEGARPPFDLAINVTLRADPLTAVMLVMVTLVSTIVIIYSIGYMRGDEGYWRFFAYVSLFVFSMTMLVSVSNFALLYVFWEAVGVCSYLLIGFWFHKPEAAAAGKKAFLVNRIGDFGFALGVFLLWQIFGTLNFESVTQPDGTVVQGILGEQYLQQGYPAGSSTLLVAACLLLFAGACGKSAQFPLHVWLPDAMEGPTPVSALIHAATMVTAGVYLVARCAPLFLASQVAPYVVAAIGGFTAILAALIALTQTDLKRVLAYSTVSQLGYMFLSLGTCSLAGVTAGMFHLFTHAFFKALLFLGAGSVMHAMGGAIDMRDFSGLRRVMPRTHVTFLVGCLALAGVVPLSGFWSKDAILGALHDRAHEGLDPWIFHVLYYLGLVTAVLTAFYTFRAFFRTFYGPERVPAEAGHHAHESPSVMTLPLVVLAIGAAAAGGLQWWFADFLGRTPSLSAPAMKAAGPAVGFHWDVALLSTVAAAAGIGLAAALYLKWRSSIESSAAIYQSPLYRVSWRKFYFDEVYLLTVVWPLRAVGYICFFLDFMIDNLVNLCGWIPRGLGIVLRPLQVGLLPFYALAMVLGLLVLIGSLLSWY